jgi:hypothetical protein
VGRILTTIERSARIADETALATVNGEVLRSAFSISARHVLTAWHCIRDTSPDQELWFRLRRPPSFGRRYDYIPLRLTNYNVPFDVAALAVDERRLAEVNLPLAAAEEILTGAAIALETHIPAGSPVQIIGFPASTSGTDSDTNSGTIEDLNLPLGEVTGIKIFGNPFAAVSPVDPHGLSGGPVLMPLSTASEGTLAAIGVVRAIPTGSLSGSASGGCLIATRADDVIGCLPEAAAAARTTQRAVVAQSLAASRDRNALAIADAGRRRLRESVVVVDDPELGELTGWPHFFNEPVAHRRPTAIGTAYGLKLAMALGGYEHGPDRSKLAATLWKLRRPDGGWAARTGTGVSRPEVSALVLGALSSSGFDETRLVTAGTALEVVLSSDADPVAMDRTYIVSAIMRGLVRAFPPGPQLARLREKLLAGAIRDPAHDNMLCWSSRLQAEEHEAAPPSAVHTAQAIVALVRADTVLGDHKSRITVGQALQWLIAHQGLANQTEQIRRFVRDNSPWETLTVRHFTAVWVARALLLPPAADHRGAGLLLEQAIRRVWQAHRNGLWEWEDDGGRPLWMTYQGASLIHDYSLRTSMPLP